MDMNNWVQVGASVSQSAVVAEEHTAPHVGSGLAPVLATPVLVNLFEAAALAVIEHQLPPGTQSLGTKLDIMHTAATPVGMRVEVTARLDRIKGNKLYFGFVANDETEQIGSGTHQRVVVDAKKFILRVAAKARK